jgi:chromosome segregation ATPase
VAWFGDQTPQVTIGVGSGNPRCQQIRGQIASDRSQVAALRAEKSLLDPRDRRDMARIREILEEVNALDHQITDLEHEAATIGCSV